MATSDILLEDDGDLPLTGGWATGDLVTVQALRRRLQLHLGEYVGDQAQGLPYEVWMNARTTPITDISLTVRQAIETFPGVRSITRWEVTHSGRSLSLAGLVVLETGAEVELNTALGSRTNALPFLLRLR